MPSLDRKVALVTGAGGRAGAAMKLGRARRPRNVP
jgi:NAD(P)-dependent dehydrogenase (short-subunit alcohol dehydrogenase family)